MIKKLKYNFIQLIVFILLFTSCKPFIEVTLKRPVELAVHSKKKIAMNVILNEEGQTDAESLTLTDEITEKLVMSKLFEIVDRQNINSYMQEHSLGQSGLIDENSGSASLGKIFSTGVMIFGRIQSNLYKEEESRSEPYTDSKGVTCVKHVRKGVLNYKVTLKLIDVETSKIIAVKSINGSAETTTNGVNKNAPTINFIKLKNESRQKVISKFVKLVNKTMKVAPVYEEVKKNIYFAKDANLPELFIALELIKSQKIDESIKLLETSANRTDLNSSVKAKAIYNYGAMLEVKGNYTEAIETYQDAIKLDNQNMFYKEALKSARKEKYYEDKYSED